MVLNIVLIALGFLFLILMIALVLNPPEALIKKVFLRKLPQAPPTPEGRDKAELDPP